MKITTDSPVFTRMLDVRRDLHQHPELSWHEERTAERIAGVLNDLGIEHETGIARTGILATLPGPPGVPAVALRADMDALPITEETSLPFASTNDGVMHACGHDGHVGILIGAAELLAAERALPAPVRLIFQPAEELGTGATAMIEKGALDGVGMIFGGHLDRWYDPGEVIVTEGPVNASTDEFSIDLTGPGGHGARPHETVDPIVVGSLLVSALQSVVTREIDPTLAAVVSVGQFHAGTAPNIIANHTRIEGTLRAQHPYVRAHLQAAVKRIAEGVATTHGVEVKVEIRDGTPPVINTGTPLALARRAAEAEVGADHVRPMQTGNMGGEDFGCYLEKVPGCFVRYGAKPPGESFPAHSSRFWWDEKALAVSASYLYRVALTAGEFLAEQ